MERDVDDDEDEGLSMPSAGLTEIREFVDVTGKEVSNEVVDLSQQLLHFQRIIDKAGSSGDAEQESKTQKQRELLEQLRKNLVNPAQDMPVDEDSKFVMELASLSNRAEKKLKVPDDLTFLDDLEAREQRFCPGSRLQMHATGSAASTARPASTPSDLSCFKASSGWKKGFFSGPKPHSGTSQTVITALTSKFKKSDISTSSVPLNVEILRPESEVIQLEQLEPSLNLAFTAQVRERQDDRRIEEEKSYSTSSKLKEKEIEAPQKPLSIFAQQRLKMKDYSI